MGKQGENGIPYVSMSWTPIRGCGKGTCAAHCWSAVMASRFNKPGRWGEGFAEGGKWTGKIALIPKALAEPLSWRKPQTVLVSANVDIGRGTFEEIAAVFGVMAACPQHRFLVLSKCDMRTFFAWVRDQYPPRPDLACLDAAEGALSQYLLDRSTWPLPNVWLGCSVENQASADLRTRWLRECPAAHRWVSFEPALECVEFDRYAVPDAQGGIDLIIMGAESGPHARPMNDAWLRCVRDQCADARVAFYAKQRCVNGRPVPFKDWPADLQVRQTPWEVSDGVHG